MSITTLTAHRAGSCLVSALHSASLPLHDSLHKSYHHLIFTEENTASPHPGNGRAKILTLVVPRSPSATLGTYYHLPTNLFIWFVHLSTHCKKGARQIGPVGQTQPWSIFQIGLQGTQRYSCMHTLWQLPLFTEMREAKLATQPTAKKVTCLALYGNNWQPFLA
jgi:hypothetical protein